MKFFYSLFFLSATIGIVAMDSPNTARAKAAADFAARVTLGRADLVLSFGLNNSFDILYRAIEEVTLLIRTGGPRREEAQRKLFLLQEVMQLKKRKAGILPKL